MSASANEEVDLRPIVCPDIDAYVFKYDLSPEQKAYWVEQCEGYGGQTQIDPPSLDTNDADKDGYKSDVDCNDNDPAINPGATEILGNGKDDDCNPQTPDEQTSTQPTTPPTTTPPVSTQPTPVEEAAPAQITETAEVTPAATTTSTDDITPAATFPRTELPCRYNWLMVFTAIGLIGSSIVLKPRKPQKATK